MTEANEKSFEDNLNSRFKIFSLSSYRDRHEYLYTACEDEGILFSVNL